MEIMRKMATKEGVGQWFGEGLEGVVNKFGEKIRDHTISLKGHLHQLDPRAVFGSAAFGQLTNPRGHQGPVMLTIISGRSEETLKRFFARIGTPEEAIDRIFGPDGYNVAIDTKYTEEWLYLLDSLGLCRREAVSRFFDLDLVAGLYSSATGWKGEPTELQKGAERIWNIEKLLNIREGFSRKDDLPPKRWLESIQFGKEERVLMDYFRKRVITGEDIAQLLQDYYKERGWDSEGKPLADKLNALDIEREAAIIKGKGQD
jgi:aldehyde:ferredoxin oxidoreductase